MSAQQLNSNKMKLHHCIKTFVWHLKERTKAYMWLRERNEAVKDSSEIKREIQDSKTVIFLFLCSILLLFVYIFKY